MTRAACYALLILADACDCAAAALRRISAWADRRFELLHRPASRGAVTEELDTRQ